MKKTVRDKKLTVMLSAEEAKTLEKRAASLGLTISAWIRQKIHRG